MTINNASVFIGEYSKILKWMWEGGWIDLPRKAHGNWDLKYISNYMYTYVVESIVSNRPI